MYRTFMYPYLIRFSFNTYSLWRIFLEMMKFYRWTDIVVIRDCCNYPKNFTTRGKWWITINWPWSWLFWLVLSFYTHRTIPGAHILFALTLRPLYLAFSKQYLAGHYMLESTITPSVLLQLAGLWRHLVEWSFLSICERDWKKRMRDGQSWHSSKFLRNFF